MTTKRLIIIVVAAAAGLWTYFAVAPFVDNAGKDDTPAPTAQQQTPEATTTESRAATTTDEDDAEVVETAEERELVGEDRFPITGTPDHSARGFVRVVQTPGEQIVRFEDYEGTDGPELHVYLAKDLEATDAVDLGPARARSGNINYGVPIDVNIDSYPYVLTWSETTDELYDYALIN